MPRLRHTIEQIFAKLYEVEVALTQASAHLAQPDRSIASSQLYGAPHALMSRFNRLMFWIQLDQSLPYGQDGGLRTVIHLELVEDVSDVILHGFLA